MLKNNSTNQNINDDVYYSVGGFIWEIVKVFVLALVIIIPIRVFLFQPFFVQGASMEPNFQDGEYLIVNELGYKETNIGFDGMNLVTVESFNDLKRGDVIIFRYPKNKRQYFIKRVIGLPGERVEIIDGKVKIYNQENENGFFLDETEYLSESVKTKGDGSIFSISKEEYFVLGDNRPFSSDSRSWGLVNKGDIIGKTFFRAWPLNKIEIF